MGLLALVFWLIGLRADRFGTSGRVHLADQPVTKRLYVLVLIFVVRFLEATQVPDYLMVYDAEVQNHFDGDHRNGRCDKVLLVLMVFS